MKTKNRIWIYSILAIGLITTNSCTKDDSEIPSIPFKKVSTIVISDDPTQYFDYNSDGKLAKVSYGYNTGNYNTYTYTDNTVIITEYYDGWTSCDTLFLNQHGYVSKKIDSGSGSITTYEYDNDGYCTKETRAYGDETFAVTSYIYQNGNLLSAEGNRTFTCLYYLDKVNTLSDEHLNTSLV